MSSGFRCKRTSWSTLTTGILADTETKSRLFVKRKECKATGSREREKKLQKKKLLIKGCALGPDLQKHIDNYF
jgi:hypothetical protein